MSRVFFLLLLVQFVCAQKKVCSCPRLMKPVCGTDGKTYPVTILKLTQNHSRKHFRSYLSISMFVLILLQNECQAKCQNVGVSNKGPCLGETKHTRTSTPHLILLLLLLLLVLLLLLCFHISSFFFFFFLLVCDFVRLI